MSNNTTQYSTTDETLTQFRWWNQWWSFGRSGRRVAFVLLDIAITVTLASTAASAADAVHVRLMQGVDGLIVPTTDV
jgi:hypothetical protein